MECADGAKGWGSEKGRGEEILYGGVNWRKSISFETRILTVIIRVFDGGEGWMRGGTAERSREKGVSVPFETGLEDGDVGGEVFCWAVMVVEAQ